VSISTLGEMSTTTASRPGTAAQQSESQVIESSDTTAGTEAGIGGAEATAALPADAYSPVSNNLGLAAGSGEGTGGTTGGTVSDEAGASAEASVFEDVGWNDTTKNEAEQLGDSEATAVDAGTVEADSQEFFQFLAPLLGPLISTVLPAAGKALIGSVAPTLLQGLGSLFGQQRPAPRPRVVLPAGAVARRETTADGGAEAITLDQTSIAEAIQQLEVVIGTDDRVQVINTREVPWKRIVQLTITAGNGRKFLGSGALIGPRTIITAGHCVYMSTQGGYVREIQCTPGRNGDQKPYGTMNASRVWTVRGWTVHHHRDCDFAAVILPRPFQASDLGSFGFANFGDLELMSSRLNLSGYPGDKPLGTQWYHGRVGKSVTSTRVYYDIDSMGGQSGSPVWVRRPDGRRYMVAVHTTGAPTGNSGVRINRQVFELFRNWRNNPDG
jgi:V8-like Glu-specific endopeptidase